MVDAWISFPTLVIILSLLAALGPGLAVFGFNMLGDGLHDVLDPRLRGGSGRGAG